MPTINEEYRLVTATYANSIGGKGSIGGKLVCFSELSNYGCKLKLDSEYQYSNNEIVRQIDITGDTLPCIIKLSYRDSITATLKYAKYFIFKIEKQIVNGGVISYKELASGDTTGLEIEVTASVDPGSTIRITATSKAEGYSCSGWKLNFGGTFVSNPLIYTVDLKGKSRAYVFNAILGQEEIKYYPIGHAGYHYSTMSDYDGSTAFVMKPSPTSLQDQLWFRIEHENVLQFCCRDRNSSTWYEASYDNRYDNIGDGHIYYVIGYHMENSLNYDNHEFIEGDLEQLNMPGKIVYISNISGNGSSITIYSTTRPSNQVTILDGETKYIKYQENTDEIFKVNTAVNVFSGGGLIIANPAGSHLDTNSTFYFVQTAEGGTLSLITDNNSGNHEEGGGPSQGTETDNTGANKPGFKIRLTVMNHTSYIIYVDGNIYSEQINYGCSAGNEKYGPIILTAKDTDGKLVSVNWSGFKEYTGESITFYVTNDGTGEDKTITIEVD